jgi:hypothetical protein
MAHIALVVKCTLFDRRLRNVVFLKIISLLGMADSLPWGHL